VLRGRRRRRLHADRRTWALGVAAIGTSGALVATELARVWQRGTAPQAAADGDVLAAADATVRETVAVARAGYVSGSVRENAVLNLMASFALTFAIVRASTHLIRRRGRFGPFRDVVVGDRHIHHFVPGIVLSLLAGGAAIIARDPELDPLLALPFGVGAALTLDESALLLQLDDVYWSEEGIVSVQITLAALALLGAGTIAARLLRRGEAEVLEAPAA
jgi:hypothetical protein